jgi:competence ComEA-like helix-hairpin-helix protein
MKKLLIISLLFLALPMGLLAETKININTATLSELDGLAGIGPKYAQGIVDGRPYSSVEDLARVKGIGPKTLQKIKDQGYACVNCTDTTDPAVIPAKAGIQSDITDTKNDTTTTVPRNDETIKNYANGIFINEILPSPQGSDETDEFFELYNSNTTEADLSGWKIKDTQGTVSTFIIPKDTKILANSYLAFYRPATKIMLNNDEDGLEISSPDGKVADSVSFTKALTGQSYDKNGNSWMWSTKITPGEKNIVLAKTSVKTLSKAKKNVNNDLSKAGVADLTQAFENTPKTQNPWPLFLTVLVVAVILSVTVLFIKLKIKNSKNYERT